MIAVENLRNKLRVSFVNEKKNIEITTLNLSEDDLFEWSDRKKDKQQINKIENLKTRKTNKLSKYRINEYLHNLNNENKKKIFSNINPQLFVFDFKTEVNRNFLIPSNPEFEIQSFTLINEKNDVLILGTKKILKVYQQEMLDKIEKILKIKVNFQYIEYDNERTMLYNFLRKFFNKIPAITSWNYNEKYLYIINRANKLNIKIENVIDFLDEEKKPIHKICFDYLQIYKELNKDQTVLKENDSLFYVASKILNIKDKSFIKNSMNVSGDFKSIVFYNIIECLLLKFLNDKLKLFSIMMNINQLTHVEFDKIFYNIHIAETLIGQYLLKLNQVLVPENHTKIPYKPYTGGYILKPEPGIYNNIVQFDFQSFYTTIIRQWYISPEAYLGKNLDEDTLDCDYTKTINGCYFKKDENNIFKTILTKFFEERMDAKNKTFKIEKEIQELKKQLES